MTSTEGEVKGGGAAQHLVAGLADWNRLAREVPWQGRVVGNAPHAEHFPTLPTVKLKQ